jgi:hypothetical protein
VACKTRRNEVRTVHMIKSAKTYKKTFTFQVNGYLYNGSLYFLTRSYPGPDGMCFFKAFFVVVFYLKIY